MKELLLVIGLSSCLLQSAAQNNRMRITAFIMDAKTGELLTDATVKLTRQKHSVTVGHARSRKEGFLFRNLDKGTIG